MKLCFTTKSRVSIIFLLSDRRSYFEIVGPSDLQGVGLRYLQLLFLTSTRSRRYRGGSLSIYHAGQRCSFLSVVDLEEYGREVMRSFCCELGSVCQGSEWGRLQSEILFLWGEVEVLIRHEELATQTVSANALLELMREWLGKQFEHWTPKEEFRQYNLVMGVDDYSGGSSSMMILNGGLVFDDGSSY